MHGRRFYPHQAKVLGCFTCQQPRLASWDLPQGLEPAFWGPAQASRLPRAQFQRAQASRLLRVLALQLTRARASRLRRAHGAVRNRASSRSCASEHACAPYAGGHAGGNGGDARDGAARSVCDGASYSRIFCGRVFCRPSPLFCLRSSQPRLPGPFWRLCWQRALRQALRPVWRQRRLSLDRLPRLTSQALAPYWASRPVRCLQPQPHCSWRAVWRPWQAQCCHLQRAWRP